MNDMEAQLAARLAEAERGIAAKRALDLAARLDLIANESEVLSAHPHIARARELARQASDAFVAIAADLSAAEAE